MNGITYVCPGFAVRFGLNSILCAKPCCHQALRYSCHECILNKYKIEHSVYVLARYLLEGKTPHFFAALQVPVRNYFGCAVAIVGYEFTAVIFYRKWRFSNVMFCTVKNERVVDR